MFGPIDNVVNQNQVMLLGRSVHNKTKQHHGSNDETIVD